MKKLLRQSIRWVISIAFIFGFLFPYVCYADSAKESNSDSKSANSTNSVKESNSNSEWEASVTPYRYVIVDGHEDKFRAQHWLNNNYTGGLNDFYAYYQLPNDVSVHAEAQAIPRNNEYEGLYEIKKKGLGYVKFDYQEFRKYYDNRGAVYYPFRDANGGMGIYRDVGSPLWYGEVTKPLALDIGHFGVETGINVEGYPNLTFGYEREFRNGSKSRLTWGSVKNRNSGGTTRKIAPAFADIAETVDKFDIKAEHTVKGVELKSEQRWEQVRIDQTRQENNFAPSWDTTATDKFILRQHTKPESNNFDTRFQAAKWFLREKVYTSAGYRYSRIQNHEWEDTREYDQYLNAISTGTNSENRFNNNADNLYDSHTWVQSAMVAPYPWLNFGTKLKEEHFQRHGESTYNVELTSPPDNRIDRFDVSNTKFHMQRLGEGLNVRFSKIPRTALYSELEFEQSRGPLVEDRDSIGGQGAPSATEVFYRETLTFIQKGIWTIGMHAAPLSFVDFTSHFRRLWKGTDYDDIKEDPGDSTHGKSAFFDGQDTHVNEFLTRLGLKLTRFFQPGFRFVHRETSYDTSMEAQPSVTTEMLSNNFIIDVSSQLLNELIATATFSRLTATTSTPAEGFVINDLPRFTSDVNTWSFSLVYNPKKNISFVNSLSYSRADNFKDFTAIGLPLGSDYRMLDLESGLKFSLMGDKIELEPKYNFYRYNANENIDSGSYTAHAIILELKMPLG